MSDTREEPPFMRYVPLDMREHYRQVDDEGTPTWLRVSVKAIRIDMLALLAHRLELLAKAIEGASAPTD